MEKNFNKNYFAPFTFIILIPIILFIILKKTNKISSNILPNFFSLLILISFLSWAYLSIKLFPKNFTGPKNIDDSEPKYQGNGFLFWLISTILIIFICIKWKNFPNKFSENFIPILLTFNIFGLIFVSYLYLRDKDNYWDKENDDKNNYSTYFKFYRGLKFHPEIAGVDVKQLTNCRFGMLSWQIIILIFAFYSYYNFGFNSAIWVTVILQSIYIAKFFFWETGYFNTLDITLDRGGYYICWGCLVFIPAFYTFTTYYLINNPTNIHWFLALVILFLGICFIWMNYTVDQQKEMFKSNNECEIDGKKAEYIDVKYQKDGKEKDGKLLTSGWWARSRHMNYVFEIGLSACWSLVGIKLGIAPFAYLFYIIALLVHRIYRDESKCKNKYGKYWDKYCEKVKYRLIPSIY